MNKETAYKFIQDNKDALGLLANRIKEYESVRMKSEYTPAERAAAIEIVEGWIMDVFALSAQDLYSIREDDSIIRRLENE